MLSVKSTKFIIYLTQVGEQSSNQSPGKGDIKKTNFVDKKQQSQLEQESSEDEIPIVQTTKTSKGAESQRPPTDRMKFQRDIPPAPLTQTEQVKNSIEYGDERFSAESTLRDLERNKKLDWFTDWCYFTAKAMTKQDTQDKTLSEKIKIVTAKLLDLEISNLGM